MTSASADLALRVQRIEDVLAIKQLAVRYALAVDERDISGWVGLFAPDVQVGDQIGRDALRDNITPVLRTFYRSVHLIAGHHIDLHTPERATGSVYCRAEHEVGQQWITVVIRYDDDYEKIDGHWYFTRRRDQHLYEADIAQSPQSVDFRGWTGAAARPLLPSPQPPWTTFWSGVDTATLTVRPVATPLSESDGRSAS